VTLTLEIISTTTGMPAHRQRSFREEGGRIGRDKNIDWVLPHNKVSSRHALITYRSGTFYIEDRSRNGVFLNSTTNRLTPGKPQALQSGDVLFIEPYEIQVSVVEDVSDSSLQFEQDEDPFAQKPVPHVPVFEPGPERVSADDDLAVGEVDPLKLLGGSGSQGRDAHAAPPKDIVSIEELERRPMAGHYQPPAIIAAPSPPVRQQGSESELIPEDYDPLADVIVPEARAVAPAPVVPARPEEFDDPFGPLPVVPDEGRSPEKPTPPVRLTVQTPVPSVAPPETPKAVATPSPRPTPVPPSPTPPPPPVSAPPAPEESSSVAVSAEQKPEPKAAAAPSGPAADLAAVLAGAGLSNVQVTPELAESFGRILTVVVAGVMDLLRARQQVKDELRMRQTQFRPADNNPLKFSANVDDALHNLLLKRNPAYLKPVDAFADAFDDLRDHQLAMLAGLRVAFEAMLAEFDPGRLEEQFDRQLKKGALLSVPAKLRYWDAYRERTRQLLADMDATFRKWFGEEFVKAYEEQLERLEAERRERNP
jgi:type VI secretion system FHA domain protein